MGVYAILTVEGSAERQSANIHKHYNHREGSLISFDLFLFIYFFVHGALDRKPHVDASNFAPS